MSVARLLALDVGDRRIGMAVSDPLGITAQPLPTWTRRAPAEDLAYILRIATEWQVAAIIVGHPLTMAGTKSPQTIKTEAFAATLTAQSPCPVQLWDERLTSAQGERAMLEDGMRREQRRGAADQVAAQLLLQHYLDTQRGTPPHDAA